MSHIMLILIVPWFLILIPRRKSHLQRHEHVGVEVREHVLLQLLDQHGVPPHTVVAAHPAAGIVLM